MSEILAIVGLPGWLEIIVIGVFALMLIGRRLPVVARTIGESVVEFKRGLHTAERPDALPSPSADEGGA